MKNYGASVRAKLSELAKSESLDFQGVLTRYATDRLLYRLSISDYCADFVLKGSLLFAIWNDQIHRPTKDADLLGFGSNEDNYIRQVFTSILSIDAEEDGLDFQIDSLQVESIRDDEEYDGKRIKVKATLHGATIPVQVDIGYGDVVTPEIVDVHIPPLIEVPTTRLRAYPRETVVSEKTEALVKLGIANSRMKDFFDLKWLAEHFEFNGMILAEAIVATFQRRGTPLPEHPPLALSNEFYTDEAKKRQWKAFVGRLPNSSTEDFADVGSVLMRFLIPPLLERDFNKTWNPGVDWT